MPICYEIEYDLIRTDDDGETEETFSRFLVREASQQTPEQLANFVRDHFAKMIANIMAYKPEQAASYAPTGDWRTISVYRC